MSDSDLRRILNDVIDDIDSGKVTLPTLPTRSRFGRLGFALGAPAALALGLAMGGCPAVSMYGGPPADAALHDSGTKDGGVDSGPVVDYSSPEVDGGPDLDSGPDLDASSDAQVDSGPVVDYSSPDVDGGGQ